MGEWMVVSDLDRLKVIDCELTFFEKRVGIVNIAAEVCDDHPVKVLCLHQVKSKVLTSPLARDISALVHFFNQLECNLQVLEGQLVPSNVVKALCYKCLFETIVPGLDLFTELLASNLGGRQRIVLLENSD